MASNAAPGATPRYKMLDHWRGLVCLVVVLEHAGVALWASNDYATGVDGWLRSLIVAPTQWNLGAPLFFVISGYCIGASIDSTRRKGTPLRQFLFRRFWRIFPPYWAAVLGFILVVIALDLMGLTWLRKHTYGLELYTPAELDFRQWFGNLTLTESWRLHLFSGIETRIYTRVAWSLCYQEQFYLVCALALVLAPRRMYAAWGLVTVLAAAFQAFACDVGASHRVDGFFPKLWHEFAVGLAVYWLLNAKGSVRARRGVVLAIVGLLAVAIYQVMITTIAAALFGLLLLAVHRWDDRIDGIARLEPLRKLGKRSFAVYLAHLPVCVLGAGLFIEWGGLTGFWTRALVVVPITTAAAVIGGCLFHKFIDIHFHRPPTLRIRLPRLVGLRPARVG